MITVKLSKNTKDKIPFTGTYDERINQLLDVVEEDLVVPGFLHGRKTSINLKEDTLVRLSSLKLTESESYENIILRLIGRYNNED